MGSYVIGLENSLSVASKYHQKCISRRSARGIEMFSHEKSN
jgi:hypothetical protein